MKANLEVCANRGVKWALFTVGAVFATGHACTMERICGSTKQGSGEGKRSRFAQRNMDPRRGKYYLDPRNG